MKYLPALILSLLLRLAIAQPLPALIPYYNGKSWGYCDSNKKVKITPQWYKAGLFYDGRAIVELGRRDSVIFALIDERGEYIIPPSRRWNGVLAYSRIVSQLNTRNADDKWGLIDSANNLLIPYLYDVPKSYPHMAFFTRRPAWDKLFMIVGKNGKKGIVDSANNTLVPFVYDDIWMSGGVDAMAFRYDSTIYFKVWRDGKCGVIDTAGREIVPCVYDALYYRTDTRRPLPYLFARKNGRMGVIDWQEKQVVPFAYDSVWTQSNNAHQFHTMNGYKRGYLDLVNRYEIPTIYNYVEPQGENFVVVRIDSPYHQRSLNGLYKNGKLVVQPQYQGLYVQGDSIIVMRYDDPMQEGHLNPKTFKLQGGWKPYVSPFPNLFPRQGFCGTAYANRHNFPDPLFIPGKGFDEKISSFDKDSIRYTVSAYVKKNDSTYKYFTSPEYQYYAVAGQRGRQGYYAVVDRELNYIVRPQSRYHIVGGSIGDGVLVAKDSMGYGLVNLNMKPLTAFQALQPRGYFAWKGKYYMVADGKLVNEKGEMPENFRHYNIRYAADETGMHPNTDLKYKGSFIAFDSMQRLGILDIDGNVRYPEISFKHKNMTIIYGKLFLVADDNRNYKLVDVKGRELFPLQQFDSHCNFASIHSAVSYYNRQTFAGLYTIRFMRNGWYEELYVDRNGTVYADFHREK